MPFQKGNIPWNKDKRASVEINTKNRLAHLGIKLSKETKAKISKATSGKKNPMFGKHHSEETKQKLRETNIGKILSKEHRRKISKSGKGRKHSKETKEKMRLAQLGEKGSNWKGGRKKQEGYILIYKPKHPFSNSSDYIMEHRLVIEQSLGRYLKPEEIVHHIDGNKKNNLEENLLLFANQSEHIKYHGFFKEVYAENQRLKQEIKELKLKFSQ